MSLTKAKRLTKASGRPMKAKEAKAFAEYYAGRLWGVIANYKRYGNHSGWPTDGDSILEHLFDEFETDQDLGNLPKNIENLLNDLNTVPTVENIAKKEFQREMADWVADAIVPCAQLTVMGDGKPFINIVLYWEINPNVVVVSYDGEEFQTLVDTCDQEKE